jgi:hypothetical protein
MSTYSIQSIEFTVTIDYHDGCFVNVYCKYGSRGDVGEFACFHIITQVDSLESE